MSFNQNFIALFSEAKYTNEMLGAGATQIRYANYANHGMYIQAFTSLSTGFERIGKLCLLLDHYIETNGQFPEQDYLKRTIGHNLVKIYAMAQLIIEKHKIVLDHLNELKDPIHQSIIEVLSDFANSDRYSNINLLTGMTNNESPISKWHEKIDNNIFDQKVSKRKKEKIFHNALIFSQVASASTSVLFISETGETLTSLEESSIRTGIYQAVAPYRQLYVLQIIRYWVELLSSLQYLAQQNGKKDIPHLSEIFPLFFNDDSYFKMRKGWNKIS